MLTNNYKRIFVLVTTIAIIFFAVVGLRGWYFNSSILNKEYTAKAGLISSENLTITYQTIDYADVVITGNSLFQEEHSDSGEYGGAFWSNTNQHTTTTNSSETTLNWQENGSSAQLSYPENSEVLYALLSWSGTYESQHNPQNTLKDSINSPITLSVNGIDEQIRPDTNNSYTFSKQSLGNNSSSSHYHNTRDITDIVKKNTSAIYTISGVPAIIDTPTYSIKNQLIAPQHFAGWSITLVYKNPTLPLNKVTIHSGIQPSYSTTSTQQPIQVSTIPNQQSPLTSSRLGVVALGGQRSLTGDTLELVNEKGEKQPLSTQYNEEDNFFNSSILQYSTSTTTHTLIPYLLEQKSYGLDITSIDINSTSPTLPKLITTSSFDSYFITILASITKIDSALPSLTALQTPNSTLYTLKNIGTLDFDYIELVLPINETKTLLSPTVLTKHSPYPNTKLTITSNRIRLDSFPSLSTFTFEINTQSLIPSPIEVISQFDHLDNHTTQTSIQLTPPLETKTSFDSNALATDDTVFLKANTSSIIDILGNDAITRINPSTLRIVTRTNSSSITIQNNAFNYTPNDGFVGSDLIEYEICDYLPSCQNAYLIIRVIE